MSNKDHKDLVNILLDIEGKVILSGYDHKIYDQLEKAGWSKIYLGEYSKRINIPNEGELKKGKEFLRVNFL